MVFGDKLGCTLKQRVVVKLSVLRYIYFRRIFVDNDSICSKREKVLVIGIILLRN
jgi:hypothetical protein